MSIGVNERIKKRIEVTESHLEGELGEILQLLKREARSGNLIVSFSHGNQVGKKFERIEPQTKKS